MLLKPVEVSKSYKGKTKRQQSLIKGETVFVISTDEDYAYTWVGNSLEIYPVSVLNYVTPHPSAFNAILQSSGEMLGKYLFFNSFTFT